MGGEISGISVTKVAAQAMKRSCESKEPEPNKRDGHEGESIESSLMSSMSHVGSMFGIPGLSSLTGQGPMVSTTGQGPMVSTTGHKDSSNELLPTHLPIQLQIQPQQLQQLQQLQAMQAIQAPMQAMQTIQAPMQTIQAPTRGHASGIRSDMAKHLVKKLTNSIKHIKT